MKGVSAVIATILLLLIVIAIVGFAFGFFQRFFGIATSQGTNQLQNIQQQTAYSIRVESTSSAVVSNDYNTTVQIRNLGTQAINSTTLSYFVANAAVNCDGAAGRGSTSLIQPNAIVNCVIDGTLTVPGCPAGSELKITTPGMPVTYTC